MKFKINLASQPYEDARRFYLIWAGVLLVIALFTAALVYGAVAGWRHAHAVNRQIAVEKSNLDRLNQQEQRDIAILNKPENRDVRDKSRVLNGLIHRKEFSWTLIFADLEQLMPTRLHVISIAPQLDTNNEIEIHMIVGGDSREKAIELVQNMEKSRQFHRAQVISESNKREGGGGGINSDPVQFEITAQYVPGYSGAPVTQERSGQ